jgi:hypothetical protein
MRAVMSLRKSRRCRANDQDAIRKVHYQIDKIFLSVILSALCNLMNARDSELSLNGRAASAISLFLGGKQPKTAGDAAVIVEAGA